MGRMKMTLHLEKTFFIGRKFHNFFLTFSNHFRDFIGRDKETVIARWNVIDESKLYFVTFLGNDGTWKPLLHTFIFIIYDGN